jgi:hypothetical protein
MSLFGETSERSASKSCRLWPTPTSADHWNPSTSESARREWSNRNLRGIAAASMSSAVASPARTSPLPERVRALKASAAAYGRSSPELLARYDRATSSWRTSQLCLDGDLDEFSETWPRSGIQAAGTVSLPLPSGHRIVEIASGS